MIGNTNGIYIPLGGGGKTYIDLLPQIDISRTLLSTESSSTTRYLEQHFWYSGNCNPDDEIIIELENPSSSLIIENPILTIKISELMNMQLYQLFTYCNSNNTGNTGSNLTYIKYISSVTKLIRFRNLNSANNATIKMSSCKIKSITSNISGSIMLFMSNYQGKFESGWPAICIYFDKNKLLGTHCYFYEGTSAGYESITPSSSSWRYVVPVVVNIHD